MRGPAPRNNAEEQVMMKQILVGMDGSAFGEAAASYALELGRVFGSRVDGLYVVDARTLEGPLMADISGWVGAAPYAANLPRFRELFEQKGRAVLDDFVARAREKNQPHETLLESGYPARVIRDLEDRYDLLVLGRKGEHAELVGRAPGSTLDRVVRHTETPCLVTPGAYRPIAKILAAYDGSPHAQAALTTAMQWSKAFDVELILVTVDEHGSEEAARTAAEGREAAAREGIAAASLVVEGRHGPAVLESAKEQGCSLIVIGAFGHSRLRQWIVGSTAAHVLAHAELPVLVVR
jgi:nucleotide-binding universal stress UspA family protein